MQPVLNVVLAPVVLDDVRVADALDANAIQPESRDLVPFDQQVGVRRRREGGVIVNRDPVERTILKPVLLDLQVASIPADVDGAAGGPKAEVLADGRVLDVKERNRAVVNARVTGDRQSRWFRQERIDPHRAVLIQREVVVGGGGIDQTDVCVNAVAARGTAVVVISEAIVIDLGWEHAGTARVGALRVVLEDVVQDVKTGECLSRNDPGCLESVLQLGLDEKAPDRDVVRQQVEADVGVQLTEGRIVQDCDLSRIGNRRRLAVIRPAAWMDAHDGERFGNLYVLYVIAGTDEDSVAWIRG